MSTTQDVSICAYYRVGLASLFIFGLPADKPQLATVDSALIVLERVYAVPARDTSLRCRLGVADTSGWIVTRAEGARLVMRLPPEVKEVSPGQRFSVGTTAPDRASAAAGFAGWDFKSDDGSLLMLLRRRPGPPGRVLPEQSYKDLQKCTHVIGGRQVIVFSYLRVTANPQEQRHETYVVTGGIPIAQDSTVTFVVLADSRLSQQRGLAIVGTMQLASP